MVKRNNSSTNTRNSTNHNDRKTRQQRTQTRLFAIKQTLPLHWSKIHTECECVGLFCMCGKPFVVQTFAQQSQTRQHRKHHTQQQPANMCYNQRDDLHDPFRFVVVPSRLYRSLCQFPCLFPPFSLSSSLTELLLLIHKQIQPNTITKQPFTQSNTREIQQKTHWSAICTK